VLFADLVGFTSLSEHRDPEDVRGLLSLYFERCRSLIERYGGTVEKFIGDAVMAVWGSPVAREDDAERAVRAALGLTRAVAALGEELGVEALRLRAGVLTGRAAVELGAESEGMVIGDAVNTASRLQSLAAPGSVLVDDATRRASEAAIAYEDAGTHQVKGREQPVHAWTALQVVAGRGGVGRSAGLEAPFVGRDSELERVIAASESTAASGRARLVTVVGEAGAGKSRLLWEFSKYTDGVEARILWHQGRCLSYGDGVAYWALAEMVRARAGIVEEEDPAAARAKLTEAVERYVSDERERRLVEPRLAHLLGFERRTASEQADLFSGWRLFFERLTDDAPVALVFEDLQWADSGLLDFIDYMLEWSADHPLFVLAIGRPQLLDGRPSWAADAIGLTPLSDDAMRVLLAGLAPGLPDTLAERIVDRAEGMPLYAVETVRMLLDRGLLVQEGARYAVSQPIDELEVPETLHALAAARLDGLSPAERAVLEDASVHGQSFSAAGVAALSSRTTEEVKLVLDGLVAKQLLGLNDDPLSAERGQYHFLQALLRSTAYERLSRRDRKARHLAVARHLQEVWGEIAPELAEVLAAHFLDAAAAEPDAADAPQIRAMARDTLAEAGRRALSLALGPEAMRAFDRAAELAEEPRDRAALLEQAGRAAMLGTDSEAVRDRLERAVELFDRCGEPEGAARCLAGVATVLRREDRLDEAIELNRRAVSALPEGGPDKASALAALSGNLAFRGELNEALEAADAALAIAEPLEEWRTLVEAHQTIGLVRRFQGRMKESYAIRELSLSIALEHELTAEALRSYTNLADGPLQLDSFDEALAIAEKGLELARSRGDRQWERFLLGSVAAARVPLGEWDQLPAQSERGVDLTDMLLAPLLARVQAGRGDIDGLKRALETATAQEGSVNVEYATGIRLTIAIAHGGLGRPREALEVALPIATGAEPELLNEDRREAFLEAGLAALELGEEQVVERLVRFVGELPPAMRTPMLRAGAARFGGLLAMRRGELDDAEDRLLDAAEMLRGVKARFVLAQVLLETAELLVMCGREQDALEPLSEARMIFERLRATPWLARADRLAPVQAA
jgi:class 3 adenylate cyclase/predicted ATPase